MASLWPVNHKTRSVDILGVTDPEGDAVTITIDAVFQDELVDAPGSGDGPTTPDAVGVGTSTAMLRAERAGNGNGRVYHVLFTARAASGTCSGEVLVGAPTSQGRKGAPVDDGPLYDSTIA